MATQVNLVDQPGGSPSRKVYGATGGAAVGALPSGGAGVILWVWNDLLTQIVGAFGVSWPGMPVDVAVWIGAVIGSLIGGYFVRDRK